MEFYGIGSSMNGSKSVFRGSIIVDSVFIVAAIICGGSLLCYAVLNVVSSFAIIVKGKKRKLVALLWLSSWCRVTTSIMWLFLPMSWVGIQYATVV